MKFRDVITAGAAFGIVTGAMGGFAVVGDPVAGNSWEQRFSNGGVMMDFIAVEMISAGDSFESPTFNDFNSAGAGWATTAENNGIFPTVAIAEGPATSSVIQFDIRFAGSMSNPLTFNIFGFLDGVLVADNEFDWDGSEFTAAPSASVSRTQEELLSLIPLPSPIALGSAGLVGVVGLRRRRAA